MSTHAWNPSDRDRMIYRWCKFEGYKQSWVAEQLEINQSTVSRILERYDRWIAHGGPAREGGLNHDERLRLQRFLTYERNERIITSALRLAGDMEQHYESSKSVIHRDMAHPSKETTFAEITAVVDRTGTACRYLRLAHRVSMEQLKLVEQTDLPALDPLLLDEHELAQAQADIQPKYVHVFPTSPRAETPTRRASEDESPSTPNQPAPSADLATSPSPCPLVSPSPSPTLNFEPGTLNSSPMPAMHNQEPTQPLLTPATTVTSLQISPHKKPVLHAYALPQKPPEPTDPLAPILDATPVETPPPIRILPLHLPIG